MLHPMWQAQNHTWKTGMLPSMPARCGGQERLVAYHACLASLQERKETLSLFIQTWHIRPTGCTSNRCNSRQGGLCSGWIIAGEREALLELCAPRRLKPRACPGRTYPGSQGSTVPEWPELHFATFRDAACSGAALRTHHEEGARPTVFVSFA